MTTGEMAAWTRRLKGILDGPADVRRERLDIMLRDLRATYGVTMVLGNTTMTVMRGWFAARLAETVREWRDVV